MRGEVIVETLFAPEGLLAQVAAEGSLVGVALNNML